MGSSPRALPQTFRNLLLLLLTLLSMGMAFAKPTLTAAERSAFIATVGEISLREEARSGVPASITAAQAILESNWGRAPIAIAGNNYFGIKCKSWWKGNTVHHEDDDYDAAGNLTQSCFRAYDSVEESFTDHSDFLRDSERYAILFQLDGRDYVGWAHGLRACGYATDPAYGAKLVNLIERYGLHQLTAQEAPRLTAKQQSPTENPQEAVTQELAAINARLNALPPANRTVLPASYEPSGKGQPANLRSKPAAHVEERRKTQP